MATPSASPMSIQQPSRPRLSWDEICARHPDEWVVLAEIRYEDDDMCSDVITGAVVLTHSKSSKGCLDEADAILDGEDIREFGHFYTGEIVPPAGWRGFPG